MHRIKELREEKGITQAELAQIVGVQNYTIGNWERNRAEPDIATIIALANYFETSVDYLLGRSDDVGLVQTNADLRVDEVELLSLYREMSVQDKNQLIGFAKGLLFYKSKSV